MKLKLYTFLLLFGFLSVFEISYPSDSDMDQAILLGTDRELFINHYLIDTLLNTRIILHAPHDEGAVLRFDKSWEGVFSGYCTIIRDGNMFRLYYRGLPKAGANNPHKKD